MGLFISITHFSLNPKAHADCLLQQQVLGFLYHQGLSDSFSWIAINNFVGFFLT